MDRMCIPQMPSSPHYTVLSWATTIGGGGASSAACIPCPTNYVVFLLLPNLDITLTICLFYSPPCADCHSYIIVACIIVISLLLPLNPLRYNGILICIYYLQLLHFTNSYTSASFAGALRVFFGAGKMHDDRKKSTEELILENQHVN